jgi:lysophospholipase L1-like esterase
MPRSVSRTPAGWAWSVSVDTNNPALCDRVRTDQPTTVIAILGGVRWGSFVAVGDSFSEGLDDPDPAGGGFRGWADLVAAALAGRREGFGYANLAIRGRLFHRVVDEQVPAALAMRADLVSFAAGGNDVLRRRFDPAALVVRLDTTVASLRDAGADVLLFRFADVTARLPGARLIGPRAELLNRAVADVARRHRALLVDVAADPEFDNPALWSVDRLHLSAAGHRRVAAHVLGALGVEPDPAWLRPEPPTARRSWPAARAADLAWAGRHLAPWVRRRITGRSSGDLMTPKRPSLGPL